MSQAELSAAIVRAKNRRNSRQCANRRDYNAGKLSYAEWGVADERDEARYHVEVKAAQDYDDGKITFAQLDAIIRGTLAALGN